MTVEELLAALDLGEGKDLEFKSARGGLPGSVWETYSAMANTDGGTRIRQSWAGQHWAAPGIQETAQPDRVVVTLPMVSLLPDGAVARLRDMFGEKAVFRLGPLEAQALVVGLVEGQVSNARMRLASEVHAADLTRMFQGLVARGFLERVGQGRGSAYRLPQRALEAAGDSPHKPGDSSHTGDSSHKPGDSSHKPPESTADERRDLEAIAAPAREAPRLAPEKIRDIILRLCDGRYLTAATLGSLMKRNPDGLRSRTLSPMVEEGFLERLYPEEPNRPDQAYTTRRR